MADNTIAAGQADPSLWDKISTFFSDIWKSAQEVWDQLTGARSAIVDAQNSLEKLKGKIPDADYSRLKDQGDNLLAKNSELSDQFNNEVKDPNSVTGLHGFARRKGLGVAPIIWAGVALTGLVVGGYYAYQVGTHASDAYAYKNYIDAYAKALDQHAPLPAVPGGAIIGGLNVPKPVLYGLAAVGAYLLAKRMKWINF